MLAYHDQDAGHINRQDNLAPPIRRIADREAVGKEVEPPKDTEEQAERRKLKDQPTDHDIAASLLVWTGPVVGAGDAGPATLDAEGDNVARDKYGCKVSTGDLEYTVLVGG